jgi:NADH-dependent peroxiredoxin subunit F
MYELIIIGGGPAGMAAAVYAARKLLNTLIVSNDIGGQVMWTNGIENYLGYQFIEGDKLIEKFQEQVNQFPVVQKIGQKVTQIQKIDGGFEVISESGERYQGKAVILASGKRPRRLEIPGETELTGRGVTYCSICDGPMFTGQKVAVIGGGNSAIEAALDMVKIAEHVDMVSVTPLTGDPIMIQKLSAAGNLTIYTEYQTEKVLGGSSVEGIIIKDIKTGAGKQLAVTGVFVDIGLVPNSDMVKGLIKLNQAGEVPVSSSCETEIPGLFAAGDVTTVPEKQIVIAAGEGAKAALQSHRYLRRLPEAAPLFLNV